VIDSYPLGLRLRGCRCVVVGGGTVALRKVGPLVEAGAEVLVIAPHVDQQLQALAARGAIRVERRPFRNGDLDGAVLAFAATDNIDVNREVAAAARERGVLVNVADDPDACDFTVPASIQRGGVTVTISTGGRSPAFARHLREELDGWLTPERCALFEIVADVRSALRAEGANPDGSAWKAALADDSLLEALATGDQKMARARLMDALRCAP
jgi:precorrin-2 dehydrogenase/sirohydrochlorin ferrochelatase